MVTDVSWLTFISEIVIVADIAYTYLEECKVPGASLRRALAVRHPWSNYGFFFVVSLCVPPMPAESPPIAPPVL